MESEEEASAGSSDDEEGEKGDDRSVDYWELLKPFIIVHNF